MNLIYIGAALAIWFLVGVVIAYMARKHLGEGMPEFFLANRKLSGFISGMTYSATTFSAFMMVGLVGLTYSTGVGAVGFEMIYIIFTILLLVIFAPRFWVAGKKYDIITPPELMAVRYNSRWVGIVSSIICLTMLIPYASVQMMGVGFLLEGMTSVSLPAFEVFGVTVSSLYLVGVLLVAGFSGISAFWAGMKSVSWTDAFQAIIMLGASIILVIFVFYHFFGSPGSFVTEMTTSHSQLLTLNWDLSMFIGLTLPWAFFALTNPQVSQRMFVSDSVKSIKKMIIYFSIFALVYTVITTLLGLSIAGTGLPVTDPDTAMPVLLGNVPVILALVVFVSIFAAATSTLSSITLTLSSLGSRDLVKKVKPSISEKMEVYSGKIIIIVILLSCIVFANLRLNMIAVLSSMASGGLLVMAPTIIGSFFWKRSTTEGALSSMVVGGVVTASLYIAGEAYYPLGWWPSFWGLLITVAVFVGVSLMTEP
ncbi:MAG: sodium:solute symporter family protein, partial [Candidatus Thermoplasmatota archaeon]